MKQLLYNMKTNWRENILAGFIVSLIALPLGLGLAVASGVPPMAGLLSILVGGIVVSAMGGSNVTISGPGNGLVVVILTAVTVLGEGDLFLGYTYALAAIFCAGLCILLLGFLRMGNLADFFPSATIQGMLSAIGLIIIAKQIHIMFGVSGVEASNNLLLLAKLPDTFFNILTAGTIPYSGIVGVMSLLIMVLHPVSPFRFLQKVPAPMLIVLFSVAFFYFYYLSGITYPIRSSSLIQIPYNLSDAIVLPNFEKFSDQAFFMAVISITLIASIESLLSIKAVDKLDVQKRRSNVNKELKALGLATSLSSLIGGLPVVAVIARSSVNVNQGATNRMANFCHALFVALFVMLFASFLNKIPLSALAAILVYTGYKLASPAKFKQMYQWGKDQFIIYLVTLLATLIFGLINGIMIGIVATFLIQLYLMTDRREFLRKPMRPNTLLFQEDDGKMYLSVKGHSSFLNYLALKAKLDSIPPDQHLILDFSLTTFVDNSVMEHIHHYKEDYRKKGSKLEVVGLDIHDPTSTHPFAARRLLKLTSFIRKNGILTYRQKKLKEFSKEIGWKFKTNSVFEMPAINSFHFFKRKMIDHAYNIFYGQHQQVHLKMMDIEFYEGELILKETHKLTVFTFSLPYRIPMFRLDKERIFDRIAGLAGLQDISIAGHEDFSKRFLLKGENVESIKSFFTDSLVLFFESNPYYHLESDGRSILIFRSQRLATISEVKGLARFGLDLISELTKEIKAAPQG